MRFILMIVAGIIFSISNAKASGLEYFENVRCATFYFIIGNETESNKFLYNVVLLAADGGWGQEQIQVDMEYSLSQIVNDPHSELVAENVPLCDKVEIEAKNNKKLTKNPYQTKSKKASNTTCECPSDRTKDGKLCGKRSVYSKSGGKVGMCPRT